MLAGLRRADRDGGARFAPEHSSNIDARLRYDSSPVMPPPVACGLSELENRGVGGTAG